MDAHDAAATKIKQNIFGKSNIILPQCLSIAKLPRPSIQSDVATAAPPEQSHTDN
mgnify:CR=1 FL=1